MAGNKISGKTYQVRGAIYKFLFILKIEINMQILNTKRILYNFSKPRYLRNKMMFLKEVCCIGSNFLSLNYHVF